jgi:hypothetical protein
MANQNPQSFKPLTISAEQLPASMARNEELTSYAASRAKLLLGCYRTGDANDPTTYVAAITAILAKFPEEVITTVTHPATGLPSKKSWLPTVKEVHDACDDAVEPIVQHQARLKRIAEQLAMRERERTGEKPTIQQLKEKYGERWGIEPVDRIKTADNLVEENREARERAEARMRAEYAEMGKVPPSKYALSQTALRIIREQDENRAAFSSAAE